MNWQLALVLLLIAVASTYLLWQAWRSLRGGKSGCGGGCGCASQEPKQDHSLISVEQLTLRLKKTK